MHAIELRAPSIDALRPVLKANPVPQPGEVLVRLRASALNFVDLAVATGNFSVPGFPLIPVADGAGEVAALGPGVTALKTGDRVIPHFMPFWQGGPITHANSAGMRGVSLPGSLADYVAVPERSVVPMPEHLEFAEAAALPIAGTTAWRALRAADVRPGSSVALLGTGGVSVMALQLAKASGATVIVTSSSDEKLARARDFGADVTINYRSVPEWDSQILEKTGGKGADLVIETGGGGTFARSLNAAAFGGVVFSIGFLSGTTSSVSLMHIIVKALRIQGNNTGPVASFSDAIRAIAAHRIKPVIGACYGMDEAPSAYRLLASGAQPFGKIVFVH
jgi:NADPH:quinone reductase-like Zn-dependent oxidoreductase